MKRHIHGVWVFGLVWVLAVFSFQQNALSASSGNKAAGKELAAPQKVPSSSAVSGKTVAPAAPVGEHALTIHQILLKGETIHVVLVSETGVPASAFGMMRLEVASDDHPVPVRWLLLKVDPQRQLARQKGSVTFDTGIRVKKRAVVKASLVQGSWRVTQNKTLWPARTTARPAGVVKAGGITPGTAAGFRKPAEMPSAMRAKQVAKPQPVTTVRGKSPDIERGDLDQDWVTREAHPVSFMLPRGGEYLILGERFALKWQTAGIDTGDWTISLKRESVSSFNEIIFSGTADTESLVWADLPATVEYGDNYFLSITSDTDTSRAGVSNFFSIGPPQDAQYIPSEEWEITIVSPAQGGSIYERSRTELRWQSFPDRLPFPNNVIITFYSLSSGEAALVRTLSGTSLNNSFDASTRSYHYIIGSIDLDPDDYRLKIKHEYNDIEGSSLSGTLSGQSSIQIAALPPESQFAVLSPAVHQTIHRGEGIPFRWVIPPESERAYGRVENIRIAFRDADPDHHAAYEDPFYGDPRTGSFTLPLPDTVIPGEGEAQVHVRYENLYNIHYSIPINIFHSNDFRITWPTSSQALSYGHTYTITWDAHGAVAYQNLSIRLMQNGSIIMVLNPAISASAGHWEWALDLNCNDHENIVPRGENFYLQLVSDGSSSFEAECAPFDLLFPEMLFDQNAPADGELWPPGSTRWIRWSTAHMPPGATLRIELQKGTHTEGVLAANVPADRGFFEWYPVGQLPGGRTVGSGYDFHIRLELKSCEVGTARSPAFRIPGGAPAGSYQSSCRYAYLDGTTLHATCQTNYGPENIVYLERQDLCTGDISNYNGELMCQHESDLPYGSYLFSCTNAHMNYGGGTLIALCPDNSGSWRRTALNPVGCTGDISNDNGSLTCPR